MRSRVVCATPSRGAQPHRGVGKILCTQAYRTPVLQKILFVCKSGTINRKLFSPQYGSCCNARACPHRDVNARFIGRAVIRFYSRMVRFIWLCASSLITARRRGIFRILRLCLRQDTLKGHVTGNHAAAPCGVYKAFAATPLPRPSNHWFFDALHNVPVNSSRVFFRGFVFLSIARGFVKTFYIKLGHGIGRPACCHEKSLTSIKYRFAFS